MVFHTPHELYLDLMPVGVASGSWFPRQNDYVTSDVSDCDKTRWIKPFRNNGEINAKKSVILTLSDPLSFTSASLNLRQLSFCVCLYVRILGHKIHVSGRL